ncbi:hypothetical protein HUJ05_010081 [Dendroctonus ponderosae]|nr:hypothetical protein HUJ05_010081 [Dendroctonus ponderosae]
MATPSSQSKAMQSASNVNDLDIFLGSSPVGNEKGGNLATYCDHCVIRIFIYSQFKNNEKLPRGNSPTKWFVQKLKNLETTKNIDHIVQPLQDNTVWRNSAYQPLKDWRELTLELLHGALITRIINVTSTDKLRQIIPLTESSGLMFGPVAKRYWELMFLMVTGNTIGMFSLVCAKYFDMHIAQADNEISVSDTPSFMAVFFISSVLTGSLHATALRPHNVMVCNDSS